MTLLQSQLSFMEPILLDELSKSLKKENIKCYTGDKMILFETSTFSKSVHRVEIEQDTENYLIILTPPTKKKEKKLRFHETNEIVQFIKFLQN